MSVETLQTKPSLSSILKNSAIAGNCVVVVRALPVSNALGWFPADVLCADGHPHHPTAPVIGMTVFGAVASTVGYLVLSRFLSRPGESLVYDSRRGCAGLDDDDTLGS
ncbi:MAG: hypothetical protein R2854_00400 [Caldilineaceae bacterium]